jgi:hypothetical protein
VTTPRNAGTDADAREFAPRSSRASSSSPWTNAIRFDSIRFDAL